MALWLDRLFLAAAEAVYRRRRGPRPTPRQLLECRVISHRGERDDRTVFENTVAAFEPLRGSGVFGIEFDVRWTKDQVPVVFHDPDLRRLFGDAARLDALTWDQLHRRRPEIPDLHGFVRRYVDEFHLMVELKADTHGDPATQNRRLGEALAPALERARVHVLSLHPPLLDRLPAIPPARTLGVARLNAEAISREALARGRAGMACHFAALRARHITRHRGAAQIVGTGFPASGEVLFHEAARGVTHVFTNHALRLERARRERLQAPPR